MAKFERDELAMVTRDGSFTQVFPDWAGQLVIIEGPSNAAPSHTHLAYNIRRLHDGAKEWFYASQLEKYDG